MIDRETVVEQAWKQVPAYTGWSGNRIVEDNSLISPSTTAYSADDWTLHTENDNAF